MGKTVLVDGGYLVALLNRNDQYREWAAAQAERLTYPWITCEAALSEAFHLLGRRGESKLSALLRRGVATPHFNLESELEPVLALMDKYSDVPMSMADACIVRMTEIYADPLLVTTDSDFIIYRRHSRQVIPCLLPE
jgi:predicted nucleic acid-binding protein